MSFFSWLIMNTLTLSYWALISGAICSYLIFIPKEAFGSEHFAGSIFAGVMGLCLAAPLLISIFLPWYFVCNRKCSFLKWVLVPTIVSLMYPLLFLGNSFVGSLEYLNYSRMVQMLGVFSLTGFLTSSLMWKFYYPYETSKEVDRKNIVIGLGFYDIFCVLSLVIISIDLFYLAGLVGNWWVYDGGCLRGFKFWSEMSAKCNSQVFKWFHIIFSNPFFSFTDSYKIEKHLIGDTISLFIYFSAVRSLFLWKKIQFNTKDSVQENAQH